MIGDQTVNILRGLIPKYLEFVSVAEATEMSANDLIDILAEEETCNAEDGSLLGELNDNQFSEVMEAIQERWKERWKELRRFRFPNNCKNCG